MNPRVKPESWRLATEVVPLGGVFYNWAWTKIQWVGAKCSTRWSRTRVNLAMWMLGGFGCSDGLREVFYIDLDGGLDTVLCWRTSYECNLYWDNTWPFKVVTWWFWKSNGVCEMVARTDGFWKIVLLSVI